MSIFKIDELVGAVVKDSVIGAGGLRFDARAGPMGRRVTNGSPPLRCFFGAVLSRR